MSTNSTSDEPGDVAPEEKNQGGKPPLTFRNKFFRFLFIGVPLLALVGYLLNWAWENLKTDETTEKSDVVSSSPHSIPQFVREELERIRALEEKTLYVFLYGVDSRPKENKERVGFESHELRLVKAVNRITLEGDLSETLLYAAKQRGWGWTRLRGYDPKMNQRDKIPLVHIEFREVEPEPESEPQPEAKGKGKHAAEPEPEPKRWEICMLFFRSAEEWQNKMQNGVGRCPPQGSVIEGDSPDAWDKLIPVESFEAIFPRIDEDGNVVIEETDETSETSETGETGEEEKTDD